jgi:beta-glucanase (GH16 family)
MGTSASTLRDRFQSCEFVPLISSRSLNPLRFEIPLLIDQDTPNAVKTRQGFDGHQYELVYSDEFNVDGRTFFPGNDPYWEAVNLWYGDTGDQEWYDPQQITTRNGSLVITMESVADVTSNHGLRYRSGMLQSWNKFCFTRGYIEVRVTFPGPNSTTQGYVCDFAFHCYSLLIAL